MIMIKRMLFVVVLMILTLQTTVGQLMRMPVTVSSEWSPLSTLPETSGIPDAWPPIEDDARDTEAPEAGDDLQSIPSGLVGIDVPLFHSNTHIHPDPRELDGASDLLLKPPPALAA